VPYLLSIWYFLYSVVGFSYVVHKKILRIFIFGNLFGRFAIPLTALNFLDLPFRYLPFRYLSFHYLPFRYLSFGWPGKSFWPFRISVDCVEFFWMLLGFFCPGYFSFDRDDIQNVPMKE
jgi:hypothetical protein